MRTFVHVPARSHGALESWTTKLHEYITKSRLDSASVKEVAAIVIFLRLSEPRNENGSSDRRIVLERPIGWKLLNATT